MKRRANNGKADFQSGKRSYDRRLSAQKAGKALKDMAKSGASGGSLRSIGRSLGDGLAAGLRAALGSVKSAANSLVAEANRAAKAKAKIE